MGINKYKALLGIGLLIVLGSLIVIYFLSKTYNQEYNFINGLAFNLISELIGIVITVFLIDFLLKKEKQKSDESKIKLYQNEIILNTHLILAYLKNLYCKYVPEDMPKSINEFLTTESIIKLKSYINPEGKTDFNVLYWHEEIPK